MKLSEVVREVIQLGGVSGAYWDVELPKHHPHYPIIRAGETEPPPPPEAIQTASLLQTLPDEQLYALMVLAYVGRGDFGIEKLGPAYRTVREYFPDRDLVIARLTEDQTLADNLTDATEEAQKHHIDLDELLFEGIPAMN